MNQECLLTVRSLYNSFSNTEKKIADYLLKDNAKVIYMSVTEFAEQCNVSETSIIRFCRKIGAKGYQEFKLKLAREFVVPEENIHTSISNSTNMSEIIARITDINCKAIQDTKRLLSLVQLEKSVEMILKAEKVDIYGVGASGFTAGDTKYKLMRLGINCEALNDPHMQCMSAVNLNERCTAIGITFSGSTKDTVDSLTLAKKSGAYTIAITNSSRSPITRIADSVLLTCAEETPLRGGSLTSKMAQLHVIDILYTAIAFKIKDRAYHNLNKTAEAVLEKLY